MYNASLGFINTAQAWLSEQEETRSCILVSEKDRAGETLERMTILACDSLYTVQ